MKCMRLIPCIALLLLVAPLRNSNAQIREPLTSRIAPASNVDTSTGALLARITALENTIAQLQQKLAFVTSVSPLVLDAGSNELTIRGAARVNIEAGTNLQIRSGSNASITSMSGLSLGAQTILDLYGRPVRHNGGTSPIACAPPTLGNQVVPCDLNVTMMSR